MKSLILQGIIQGLTEFLPVSSSGHLLFIQSITNFKGPNLFVDVILHIGTFLVVIIFYFKDIKNILENFLSSPFKLENKETKLGWLIIVANIPTAIIGIIIKKFFPDIFESLKLLMFTWGFTGIILILSDRLKLPKKDIYSINWTESILIGIAQGVAVLPGISRAGITIICGLFLSIKREDAAKFSFLLSIPAIFGALLIELFSLNSLPESLSFLNLASGFLSSLFFGVVGIFVLLKFLKNAKFKYFGIYLFMLVLIIIVNIIKKNELL